MQDEEKEEYDFELRDLDPDSFILLRQEVNRLMSSDDKIR